MTIGAHIDRGDVLGDIANTGSEVAQIFLSSPRSWDTPKTRGDEAALRECGTTIFVHGSYLINPASLNPDVRAKSRSAIIALDRAAAEIGAAGLVIHGGHPTGAGTVQDGIDGWLETLSGVELRTRLLIENTAGGSSAVARRFDAFCSLYEQIHDANCEVGVCLDTCHAHAGGEDLVSAAERLRSFAGKIDLVHANDSRDTFDSGRDRHANFDAGFIGLEAVAHVVREARCPAVVETPGGVVAMRNDIDRLRAVL